MTTALEQFKAYAGQASFHYADDSCKEWGRASECAHKAIEIYKNNPQHHNEMREHMNGELWNLEFLRKVGVEGYE